MTCERVPVPGGFAIVCGRNAAPLPSDDNVILEDMRRQLALQRGKP